MPEKCRVAVLGAGASGLAQLRAFEAARRAGIPADTLPDVVCYEKQSDWGGIWNYTWRTGLDEFGEPVHSSMYRYLWSNAPKECLEFADYTFLEHFGKALPSFPPRVVLWDYITGRLKKSDVRKYICFCTVVRWVEFDEERQKFRVTVKDLKGDVTRTEEFDWVVVATGHFSVPHFPVYPGMDKFPGRILHSHDFRDAAEFAGKNVMVIGRSYSAEDIAVQCHKYGAASVIISSRRGPFGFDWPPGITERPLLRELQGKTAHFRDGSTAEVDVIILATGFQHHFPFLPDTLRLQTANLFYPPNLYKGIFWNNNPRLIYLGMQDQCFTFPLFDAQAWYARDVILGRITLPGREERGRDAAPWREREAAWTPAQKDEGIMIHFQGEYVQDLLDATDYPKFDVQAMVRTFEDWEHQKVGKGGILTYRDKAYKSLITGCMAPEHHTKWMEERDDSFDNFIHGPAKN